MYIKKLETFSKEIEKMKKDFYHANESLNYADNKTQDILHELELENKTYHEKAKLAGELEEIRKIRRFTKNEIESLTVIINFIDKNKKPINQLSQVLGELRKVKKVQENRQYNKKALEKNDENLFKISSQK